MQRQDNTMTCYWRKPKNPVKNLSATLQVEIDLLENKVGVHKSQKTLQA